MKMKNKVFLVFAILLIFGSLPGCSNGSTDTPGVYDGIGVWLVTGENGTAWVTSGYEQPTPTAIGFLDGTISALSDSFSVKLLVPHDYSDPGEGGAWAAKYPPEDWLPETDDYHVLLVPMWWPSGVSGDGNFTWMFDEGKVSATSGNLTKLNITDNPQPLNLADFQNWGDVSS
jgi:hypothetical protein